MTNCEIIYDIIKVTFLSASSVEKDIKSGEKVNKTELSKIVATKLAKKAQEKENYHFPWRMDCSGQSICEGGVRLVVRLRVGVGV